MIVKKGPAKILRYKKNTLLSFLVPVFLIGRGLDSVNYLAPVDSNNVQQSSVYSCVINNLPEGPGHSVISNVTLSFQSSQIPNITSSDINSFHNNFVIYYRIYLSPALISSISESELNAINAALYSDYNTLKPYTVVTNNYAASVASAFSNRSYRTIDSMSNPYLLRSADLITPYPRANRYFFNDPELKAPEYLNANNNADVVSNTSGTAYSYVSLYVAHTAFDTINLTPYYSSPTFLGVYLLPDTTYSRPVTATVTANGTFSSSATTLITINFSEAIVGLIESELVITDSNPRTGFTQGAFSGSGDTYTVALSNITSRGTITVGLNKAGYTLTPATVEVYPEIVNFLLATHSSGVLTLVFDKPIFGLNTSDISITSSPAVTVSSINTVDSIVYQLNLSGTPASGSVTINRANVWWSGSATQTF